MRKKTLSFLFTFLFFIVACNTNYKNKFSSVPPPKVIVLYQGLSQKYYHTPDIMLNISDRNIIDSIYSGLVGLKSFYDWNTRSALWQVKIYKKNRSEKELICRLYYNNINKKMYDAYTFEIGNNDFLNDNLAIYLDSLLNIDALINIPEVDRNDTILVNIE